VKKIIVKIITGILISSFILILNPAVSASVPADRHGQNSVSYYDKISLAEELPKTFYKNEIYLIKGKITSGNYELITAVLQKPGSKNTTPFSAKIINNTFSIPVFFSQPGDFLLGLVPGDSGNSKALNIKVESSIPVVTNNLPVPKINSFSINYKKDQTFIKINAGFPTIKKINFVQGDKKLTYLSRQNTSIIPVNYNDFKSFSPGSVTLFIEAARLSGITDLKISSNFIKSSVRNFIAIEHTFSDISKNDIQATPPDTLAIPSVISFSGKTNTDIEQTAYVIRPNGFVDTLDLSTNSPKGMYYNKSIIKSGGDYAFSYTPSGKGRYIVEISNKEGLPIVNHPVYIGSGIPLIPDYFDTHQRNLTSNSIDLDNARKELLEYINKERIKQNLKPVETTQALNDFAQAHSKDMATNNYFSHSDQKNNSPEDRRLSAGLKTPVSENIAKDISIAFAHHGLMRSASHRENILQKDWTRVGLGIAPNDGYLYITEEFSTTEPTTADLKNYKDELFTTINNLREENSVPDITLSPSLTQVCKDMNDATLNDGTVLSNNSLSKALDKYGIDGTTFALGRTFSAWNPILSTFTKENRLLEKGWKTIGIDIQIDKFGNIIIMTILNKP